MAFLDGYSQIIACKKPKDFHRIRVSGYDLEMALPHLSKFTEVTHFECVWGGMWDTIPAEILQLPKLEQLTFSNNQLSSFPGEISLAQHLRVLDLSKNNIRELDSDLLSLTNLEELHLGKNPIGEIDDSILQLKKLKSLDISGAILKQLPKAVIRLIPQLSELFLSRKLLKEFQKQFPNLYKQLPYPATQTAIERKYGSKVIRHLRLQLPNWPYRAFLLNLLANNEPKIKQLATPDFLYQAINLKQVEPIRLKALEVLSQQCPPVAIAALAKDACLVVQGKLGINKNELRAKLKEHGIRYSAKLNDKATHFLCGQLPGEMLTEAARRGLYILTERNIIDYWEQQENPYLLEEEERDYQDNLGDFLLSNDEDNVMIALSMFRDGGFPKSLITELFIAFKTLADNSKAQREAERLLRQYGSADLVARLRADYSLFSSYHSENTVNRFINKYAKQTELNGIKLARYIFERHGGAVIYLLRKLPEEEGLTFLRQLVKDKTLDLSNKGLQNIPNVVYQLKDEIEHLVLSNNSIKKLSSRIKVFSKLKSLNLRYNHFFTKQDHLQAKQLCHEYLPQCELLL